MLLPDKIIRYKKSVISKFVPILEILKERSENARELYEQTKVHFSKVSEFIQTLDALYALGKIDMNEKGEIVCLQK